ncbi:MAG TPA: hypothetical protein VFZ65_16935 [Planctomycetota bacterium]|nr:hypothetical protein [Planctomycetota bacterium]
MNFPSSTMVLATCAAFALRAQEPVPAPAPAPTPAPAPPAAAGADARAGDTWSEGFGRATNYRTALANAIEDAVAKVKGIGVARGPAVRSRLSVVSNDKEAVQEGWFNGESDGEREWVQQQIAGFVLGYEILHKEKAADGQWEITVKADVASNAQMDGAIVIDLQDSDLRKWQLERFAEEDPSRAFAQQSGEFAGPRIADYLRKSRLVKIVAKGAGVSVTDKSAARQKEKAGHQVVASHKVVINWQPIVVHSVVDRPNKARPTSGPRPEYLTGGSVQVSIAIEDLVENTQLLDEVFTVPADAAQAQPVDHLDDFINLLVDKAKAVVAEKVYFALKPPVVLRRWKAEDGSWLIEARVARRVAAGYQSFAIGNNGSLASPDWQPLGRALLLPITAGGTADTCVFRLEGIDDPDRIEPDVTEVHPLEK